MVQDQDQEKMGRGVVTRKNKIEFFFEEYKRSEVPCGGARKKKKKLI